MKLKDIANWQDTEVRTIKVMSDVSPVPLELSVRKFMPIPQDSLTKSWMDGKVKKYKKTTPYAVVNMFAAAEDMKRYVDNTVVKCLTFSMERWDSLVQQTYSYAWKYMQGAPVSFFIVFKSERINVLMESSMERRSYYW